VTIASLHINHFRNLVCAELAFACSGINLIYGNNGSGKTSLLEAIYYLGMGRSFRSANQSRLIHQASTQLTIFSKIVNGLQQQISLGIEKNSVGAMRLRVDGRDASRFSELACYLPIRLIDTQSHHLFESGPAFRRKFLDWGLFYQSDAFLSCWRHYERALKQRNVLLRDKSARNDLKPWTDELVRQGLILTGMRQAYVSALLPIVLEITSRLLGDINVTIRYDAGWEKDEDLATRLEQTYFEEIRAGYTLRGPHRADMEVLINEVPVKHFLSRGQQKMLICAMIVAQGRLLMEQANKRLIYLIDDLPAELDDASRQQLISLLSDQSAQVFMTAIDKNMIIESLNKQSGTRVKMFHVEHGNVTGV
jgi:DNA replication and repair protein RecF